MSTVAVTVNGAPVLVAAGTTVADIVAEHAASPRGTAVARNRDVVPRSAWPTEVVVAGDEIEILAAAQGGC